LQNAPAEEAAWWTAGWHAGLAHKAASAKSIAPSQLHPPKNLHGGLRCATLYPSAYYVYTSPYQWLDNGDEAITLSDSRGEEIDKTQY